MVADCGLPLLLVFMVATMIAVHCVNFLMTPEREALDDALEGEAPKAAVIQLILAAQQAQLEMG